MTWHMDEPMIATRNPGNVLGFTNTTQKSNKQITQLSIISCMIIIIMVLQFCRLDYTTHESVETNLSIYLNAVLRRDWEPINSSWVHNYCMHYSRFLDWVIKSFVSGSMKVYLKSWSHIAPYLRVKGFE